MVYGVRASSVSPLGASLPSYPPSVASSGHQVPASKMLSPSMTTSSIPPFPPGQAGNPWMINSPQSQSDDSGGDDTNAQPAAADIQQTQGQNPNHQHSYDKSNDGGVAVTPDEVKHDADQAVYDEKTKPLEEEVGREPASANQMVSEAAKAAAEKDGLGDPDDPRNTPVV